YNSTAQKCCRFTHAPALRASRTNPEPPPDLRISLYWVALELIGLGNGTGFGANGMTRRHAGRAPGRRDLATAGSAVTAGSRPVEQVAMRGKIATVQFFGNRSCGSCATDGTFRRRLTFHEKSPEDALGSTRRRGGTLVRPGLRPPPGQPACGCPIRFRACQPCRSRGSPSPRANGRKRRSRGTCRRLPGK